MPGPPLFRRRSEMCHELDLQKVWIRQQWKLCCSLFNGLLLVGQITYCNQYNNHRKWWNILQCKMHWPCFTDVWWRLFSWFRRVSVQVPYPRWWSTFPGNWRNWRERFRKFCRSWTWPTYMSTYTSLPMWVLFFLSFKLWSHHMFWVSSIRSTDLWHGILKTSVGPRMLTLASWSLPSFSTSRAIKRKGPCILYAFHLSFQLFVQTYLWIVPAANAYNSQLLQFASARNWEPISESFQRQMHTIQKCCNCKCEELGTYLGIVFTANAYNS